MKRRAASALLALAIVLALALGGRLLYHHFVTDRITDWGGMENPDAQSDTE